MRGLTRRWLLSERACRDADGPWTRLPLVRRVLAVRGLDDADAIERFCDPRLTHLHDPGRLGGIDDATVRILEAVRGRETIAIYGDYDVDGMTATAILFHLLRALDPEARVVTYVPHRIDEGYGLNREALRHLREERGADLVVSVDCGITAVDEARYAREIGLDLIITDHHQPPAREHLPPAIAIVHPRLPGGDYPFGDLCGAGVAWKLAWRLATTWCGSERVSASLQRTLLDLLPLAGLGTIADVVPLVDENRIIASFGLATIRESPLPGIRALLASAGLIGEAIDAEKVGFVLGPRLNACGRMGHAAEAVELLTGDCPQRAQTIADGLDRTNRRRQQIERAILEQAVARAEAEGMTGPDCRAIVLADPEWHPGVVGIVCSRLAERFGRPAILMQEQGDTCRGSARSIDGYSIHAGLVACAEHIETFGGHEHAAGLAVATERLSAFRRALVEHATHTIAEDQLVASIRVDCDAALRELDESAVRDIGRLAPFGRANRRPTLRLRDLRLAGPPQRLGAEGRHLALRLADPAAPGSSIRALWWRAAEHAPSIPAGARLDVAVEPKLNTFRGRTSVEAEIRDVAVRA